MGLLPGKLIALTTYLIAVCLFSISFLVFVNASISFIITDIVGKKDEVGTDVGNLGFVDELVAVVACPTWGLISDRIGSRAVVTVAYLIMGTTMFLFVNSKSVVPHLLLIQILFSIGGAAASTMVTAILPTLSEKLSTPSGLQNAEHQPTVLLQNSDGLQQAQDSSNHIRTHESSPAELQGPRSSSFQVAGLTGTAAGLGALLALFGFLRLPPFLQDQDWTPEDALKTTFYLVGLIAFIVALLNFFGLRFLAESYKGPPTYNNRRWFLRVSSHILKAVTLTFRNRMIGLSYLGGFVARASSVCISLFVPLWVNNFFIKEGQCHTSTPANLKHDCHEAYRLASILTGVSQLAALLCAPLYGIVSDKYGYRILPIAFAAAAGTAGSCALASIDDPRLREGSIGPYILVVVVLMGLGQIGAIVCSLGLLSTEINSFEMEKSQQRSQCEDSSVSANQWRARPIHNTDESLAAIMEAQDSSERSRLLSFVPSEELSLHRIKGSIAGIYSLSGGIGILILTKLGGALFDNLTPTAPFIMLAVFNAILLIVAVAIAGVPLFQRAQRQAGTSVRPDAD